MYVPIVMVEANVTPSCVQTIALQMLQIKVYLKLT